MEIRPFTEAERRYSYTQSAQLQGQTGSIGYLRGDFDKSGSGFYCNWFDFRKHWKTEAFKSELDEVINTLRFGEGGLLKDRPSMIKYSEQYPDSSFDGNFSTEFGFRVDTEKYAYLIRCNPMQGDYNFYVYCYISEWLDKHMENAQRGIRFIDPRYQELFQIPDGGKIVITSASGEEQERVCRYIDECHTEIGSVIYHICEFAERMQENGSSYEPKQEEQVNMKMKEKESGQEESVAGEVDNNMEEREMEQMLEINSVFGNTEQVQVTVGTYQNNKTLYIGLSTYAEGDMEPYGDVTVNLSLDLPPYCAFVDTNNMPGAEDFLAKNKLAEFTGLSQPSGFCSFPLYIFNSEKLREFCPAGIADYERENGLERRVTEKAKNGDCVR